MLGCTAAILPAACAKSIRVSVAPLSPNSLFSSPCSDQSPSSSSSSDLPIFLASFTASSMTFTARCLTERRHWMGLAFLEAAVVFAVACLRSMTRDLMSFPATTPQFAMISWLECVDTLAQATPLAPPGGASELWEAIEDVVCIPRAAAISEPAEEVFCTALALSAISEPAEEVDETLDIDLPGSSSTKPSSLFASESRALSVEARKAPLARFRLCTRCASIFRSRTVRTAGS